MGAGASREYKTRYTRNFLHRIQRQLAEAGVSTVYNKGTASTIAKLVFFEGDGAGVDGGFNITFGWGNMSNGESVGTARVYLVYQGKTEIFCGLGVGYNDIAGSFDQGLTKIKQLFKK